MDVYGVEPVSSVGRYFRASIWEWRPIHERLAILCGDFLDDQLLGKMAYNGGAGPRDQETCTKIAERFEVWLSADSRKEFPLVEESASLFVTEDGRLISDEELASNPELKTRSPYSVRREEVEEFVEFLKSCGGFCVW
jgi:hypothetical protein